MSQRQRPLLESAEHHAALPASHTLQAMPKLEIRNLSVEYTMQRTNQRLLALHQLNLAVDEGEMLTVLGPSGSGKTTLLNAIAGLVPIAVGEILLNGAPVRAPGRDRAMVFQSPSLFPWSTVLKNVMYGMKLQGIRAPEAEARARRYIALVALRGFEDRYPHELSGGMQQRANLARALATEPEVLLLDEPLAALDARLRESMQDELQRIWMQARTTAVLVTHQIDEAIFLGDRVALLTTRPGAIHEIVSVDLDRPRTAASRRTPGFRDLEDYLRDRLQVEHPDRVWRDDMEATSRT